MESIHPTTTNSIWKNPVNNGINYQHQLVSRISEPSTVLISSGKTERYPEPPWMIRDISQLCRHLQKRGINTDTVRAWVQLMYEVRFYLFVQIFEFWGWDVLRYTLPETNIDHWKMDGWNTTFLLGRPIFRCYVSFREGNFLSCPNKTLQVELSWNYKKR